MLRFSGTVVAVLVRLRLVRDALQSHQCVRDGHGAKIRAALNTHVYMLRSYHRTQTRDDGVCDARACGRPVELIHKTHTHAHAPNTSFSA